MKGGISTSINTKHQCITLMKEYHMKSLEVRTRHLWLSMLKYGQRKASLQHSQYRQYDHIIIQRNAIKEINNMVLLHSCLICKNNLDISGVLKKSTCTCTCTRSSDSLTFRIPIFKTKLFQFSYFIRSVKLWNSLPFDIRSEQNQTSSKAL